MTHKTLALLTAIAGLAATMAAPARAVPLAPGDAIDSGMYDLFEVSAGDADWTGTVVSTTYATAEERRDGFVPPDVVPDLYVVTGTVKATVTEATNGQTVFGYDFAGDDNLSPGANGPVAFTLSGFGGVSVDFAYMLNAAFPYAPSISRSGDGDSITVAFFDPLDLVTHDIDAPSIETLLFSVGAPGWGLDGTGTADLVIDTFGTVTSPLVGDLPSPAIVPLPAGIVLLASSLAGLAGLARGRRRGANRRRH